MTSTGYIPSERPDATPHCFFISTMTKYDQTLRRLSKPRRLFRLLNSSDGPSFVKLVLMKTDKTCDSPVWRDIYIMLKGLRADDWERIQRIIQVVGYKNLDHYVYRSGTSDDWFWSLVQSASTGGHVQTLSVLLKIEDEGGRRGYHSFINGIYVAARYGQFRAVKYLMDAIPLRGMYIDREVLMNSAIEGGHLFIMKWLNETNGFSYDEHARARAAFHGRVDVLDMFDEIGVPITYHTYEMAVLGDQLDILYRYSVGMAPYVHYVLKYAIAHKRYEIVKWLRGFKCVCVTSVSMKCEALCELYVTSHQDAFV